MAVASMADMTRLACSIITCKYVTTYIYIYKSSYIYIYLLSTAVNFC